MIDSDQIKQEMCDIGHRMYARQFVAANEGNLSVRVGENRVLCTPTMFCKGFMTPDDIATVDMQGEQVAGRLPRTSEVLMHLEIMRARPDVQAVVHCHPPHATAFAIAREPIPTCVHPEAEIFLGEVPIAPYTTPGDHRLAQTLLPFVDKTNTIVLANHGTVSYDTTLERAYWWTEILDAYCRMLILAGQLGRVHQLSSEQGRELLELKQRFGLSDPRDAVEMKQVDLRESPLFRSTWDQAEASAKARGIAEPDDHFVERIAQRVAALLRG